MRIGRIRAEFTFGPEQGQLATRNGPPLLTSPSRAKLGLDISADMVKEFQACIAAPEGYTLLEFDFVGFHALILGHLANDLAYMRLSQLGVHDFLVRLALRLDEKERMLALPDAELKALLKETKRTYPSERNQCKEICHGSGFMEGPNKIAEKYHLIFNPSLDEAGQQWDDLNSLAAPPNREPYVGWWKRCTDGPKTKLGLKHLPWADLAPEDRWTYVDWMGLQRATRLSQIYHSTFPAIKRWHSKMLDLAGRTPHCIKTESGSRFFFFDVGHTDAKGQWRSGTDLNNIFSSAVQANAFQHIKEAMIELAEQELDERYGMYLQLHDALHFCCKDEYVEEAIPTVQGIMEAPSRYMIRDGKGLSCGVDTKIGKDRASLKEI